jgi:hypothetical protein
MLVLEDRNLRREIARFQKHLEHSIIRGVDSRLFCLHSTFDDFFHVTLWVNKAKM